MVDLQWMIITATSPDILELIASSYPLECDCPAPPVALQAWAMHTVSAVFCPRDWKTGQVTLGFIPPGTKGKVIQSYTNKKDNLIYILDYQYC